MGKKRKVEIEVTMKWGGFGEFVITTPNGHKLYSDLRTIWGLSPSLIFDTAKLPSRPFESEDGEKTVKLTLSNEWRKYGYYTVIESKGKKHNIFPKQFGGLIRRLFKIKRDSLSGASTSRTDLPLPNPDARRPPKDDWRFT